MDCICCQKQNQDDIIYETKYWIVTLSSEQSYLGRCYVTLKRHCGNLSELKQEEWSDFIELIKVLESALRKSFNATMFNWTCLMNDAYKNNPPNPHVHWHFRPRYNHKIKFENVIFEDPEFGNHYNRNRTQNITKKLQQKIIIKIKENL